MDVLDDYGNSLKQRGVPAVLVNGTTGEGTLLTLGERKQLTEAWRKVCTKHDIYLMVMITGCNLKGVEELARHAEKFHVDGVLCLPELYHKPKSIEKLVDYFKIISNFCPETALYYYHYPVMSGVDLNVAEFMERAKQEIPTFYGIKYTSGDLEKGIQCLKHGQVFLGSDTVLLGAMALGFNSTIMTTLNICPEHSIRIMDAFNKGKLSEALQHQQKLNYEIQEILKLSEFLIENSEIFLNFSF